MTIKYNRGIDYGRGMRNCVREEKLFGSMMRGDYVRFGVINQNQLVQAWADESELMYPCDDCDCKQGSDECASAMCEPIGAAYEFAAQGYKAYAGSDGDIFVERSPFFTFAQFCSPCAPGACHLSNPIEVTEQEIDAIAEATCTTDKPEIHQNICYCFGHDWFYDTDDERAPYDVYDVKTGRKVEPPKNV